MSNEVEVNAEVEVPAKVKKPKKEKALKVERDVQNGVTRPAAGTQTGRIWEIADELSAAAGEPIARKAVMDVALKEGLVSATIATQYGHWRRYNGLVTARVEAAVETAGQALPDVQLEGEPVVVPAPVSSKKKKK